MDQIPKTAPIPSKMKFSTMTAGASFVDTFINLRVLAKYIPTNEETAIVGVKFEDTVRGEMIISEAKKAKKAKKASKGKKKRFNDFKHQCTLLVRCPDKTINIKLFNNGNMVCTGCQNTGQAQFACGKIAEAIHNLNGYLEYDIPTRFTNLNSKKIYKQTIVKFTHLIYIIAKELNIDFNLEPFNPTLTKQEGSKLFKKELDEDDQFEEDLMFILTIIKILKTYYGEEALKKAQSLSEFSEIFDMLVEHIDNEKSIIGMTFSSYLYNENKIKLGQVSCNLINHVMTCNYAINRNKLIELMEHDKQLKFVNYKNNYSGAKAYFDCSVDRMEGKSNRIVIIFFGSGKMNVTAARTFNQCDEVYKYICNLFITNFDELLMKTAYNKKKKIDNIMPNQVDIGIHNGYHFIQIKKSHILRNPRNINLLNTFKILDEYK